MLAALLPKLQPTNIDPIDLADLADPTHLREGALYVSQKQSIDQISDRPGGSVRLADPTHLREGALCVSQNQSSSQSGWCVMMTTWTRGNQGGGRMAGGAGGSE